MWVTGLAVGDAAFGCELDKGVSDAIGAEDDVALCELGEFLIGGCCSAWWSSIDLLVGAR
jgi:hypothetical protein